MKALFQPGTGIPTRQEELKTPAGRGRLFNARIDQLMQTKQLSYDQAIHEMRTGGDTDDVELLSAMGEQSSEYLKERLDRQIQQRRFDNMKEQAAAAQKDAPEVAKAITAAQRTFNVRMDELTRRGLTTDQAINAMRSDRRDTAILREIGFHD